MKKFFFLALCILLSLSARSQEGNSTMPDTRTYTEQRDSVFGLLNKSRVPYGILYNRVFPFAQLDAVASGDTVSLSHWIQGLSELQRARYGPAVGDSFLNENNIRDFLKSENRQHRIPLLVLDARFATLDTTAVLDGRLDTAGGLFHDGANSASPYLSHRAVLPAIGALKKLEAGTDYTLYFTTGYEFRTEETPVLRATVTDQLEGTAYTLNGNGSELTVRFNADGVHLFDIALGMADGSTRRYYQRLYVGTAKVAGGACETPVQFLSSLPYKYQGYEESTATEGHGEYKIYYANPGGNCKGYLNKPIILLDGYDAGDERGIDDVNGIYRKLLLYKRNGQFVRLGDELRKAGYDVIILNFTDSSFQTGTHTIKLPGINHYGIAPVYRDGGVDYMERNAMLLVRLIEKVNAELTTNYSSEKLVVVGPSMGGQISRYALRWMEQNGKNHNTRLWVAFDSPNWGANIPFGFQSMIQYFAQKLGNTGAQFSYNSELQSPATRQLLIHQTNPNNVYDNNPYFMSCVNNAADIRADWRTKINGMGYPGNLRKVAISNGTTKGGNYYTGGSAMFNVQVKTNTFGMTVLDATPHFLGNSSTSNEAVRIWKAGSGWVFNKDARTDLPYGILDGCPGGTYDVQQSFYSQVDTDNYARILNFNILAYGGVYYMFKDGSTIIGNRTHKMAFIPTVSALGIINPNFNWSSALGTSGLRCALNTPFDNFYTAPSGPNDTNQQHVTLTQANIDWLFAELDADYKIVVNQLPRRCTNVTYQLVPPVPQNCPGVYWQVLSGNGVNIVSSTKNSVTVRGNTTSQGGGPTVIQASIGDPNCATKPLFLVKATIPAPIYWPIYDVKFTGLSNCNYQASVTPVIAGDKYYWSDGTTVNTPSGPILQYTQGGPNFYPSYYPNGYIGQLGANIPVYVKIVSGCISGDTAETSIVFNRTKDACTPDTYYPSSRISSQVSGEIMVIPNPTNTDWMVRGIDPKTHVIEASLKDVSGRILWVKTVKDTDGFLPPVPGNGLSAGIYFLTVRADGKQSQFKLVKQ